MSTFRQAILDRMKATNFGEEALADQVISIIKGERVVKSFSVVGGKKVQTGEVVTVDPKDAGRGLVIHDRIMGGALGLTPKTVEETAPQDRLYAMFAPKRDERVVAHVKPVQALPPEVASQASPEQEEVLSVALPEEVALPGVAELLDPPLTDDDVW